MHGSSPTWFRHLTCHIILTTSVPEEDTDGGTEESNRLQGLHQDFHQIFAQSDFDGNPEETAFSYFKPHLGNLEFQDQVSEKHSVRNAAVW